MEKEEKVKKNNQPKIINPQQIVYTFTCKKCGSHSFRNVSLHTHKFGGPGLGNAKAKVCVNCGWADRIID